MPRGMDERFEDPSEEVEEDSDTTGDGATTTTPDAEQQESQTPTKEQPGPQRVADAAATEPPAEETEKTDDEPLNIREDWDSATIYVEPDQSEDIEITFTRLKKQLKRENATLEKNKHFYRGVFEIAFGEHQEETKEKIRELAKEDADQ